MMKSFPSHGRVEGIGAIMAVEGAGTVEDDGLLCPSVRTSNSYVQKRRGNDHLDWPETHIIE